VLAMNIAARSVMPWATSADRGLRSLKNVAVADVKSRPLFTLNEIAHVLEVRTSKHFSSRYLHIDNGLVGESKLHGTERNH